MGIYGEHKALARDTLVGWTEERLREKREEVQGLFDYWTQKDDEYDKEAKAALSKSFMSEKRREKCEDYYFSHQMECSTKLGWYRADLLALDAVIGMGADGRRARALELQGVREREAREREAQEREREAREREQCFAALRQAAADLDARVPSAE